MFIEKSEKTIEKEIMEENCGLSAQGSIIYWLKRIVVELILLRRKK